MISINKTKSGQFFVRISGRNNQILMSGEPLKTKASAKKQILAMYRELTGKKCYVLIEVWDDTIQVPRKIYV